MKKNTLNILKVFIVAILIIPCLLLFAACDSDNGLSAYEIAVKNGFVGSEVEWLASLKDEKGEDQSAIQSLYDSYKQAHPDDALSFDEWFEQLKTEIKGETGVSGDSSVSFATNKAITSISAVYTGYKTTAYYYSSAYYRTPYKTDRNYMAYYTGASILFKNDTTNKIAYFLTNYHVVYSKVPNLKIIQAPTAQSAEDIQEIEGTGDTMFPETISLFYYGINLAPTRNNMSKAISAKFIGGMQSNDIAVLAVTGNDYDKLIAAGVTTATVEDSNNVRVGDTVVAIGNPDGDGISATSGIISVDRENLKMTGIDGLTQETFSVMRIDAAINGGNSGGGLFDKNGNLIGVVNAKTVATEIEGMNYAIPINLAVNIANNIVRNSNNATLVVNPQKCLIGISMNAKTSKAVYNEETKKVDIIETVQVSDVAAGSLAYNHLQVGDIIKSFTYENKTYNVTRTFQISDFSYNFESGKTLRLTIERNNITRNIDLTLSSATAVN